MLNTTLCEIKKKNKKKRKLNNIYFKYVKISMSAYMRMEMGFIYKQ
jgi:hypothetical protein